MYASGRYPLDPNFLETFSNCQFTYFEQYHYTKSKSTQVEPFVDPNFFPESIYGTPGSPRSLWPLLIELVMAEIFSSWTAELNYPVSYYNLKHSSHCTVQLVHVSNLNRHIYRSDNFRNLKVNPAFVWILNDKSLADGGAMQGELLDMNFFRAVVLNVVRFEVAGLICMPSENPDPSSRLSFPLHRKELLHRARQLSRNLLGGVVIYGRTHTPGPSCGLELGKTFSASDCIIAWLLSRELNFTLKSRGQLFAKSHGFLSPGGIMEWVWRIKEHLNRMWVSPVARSPRKYGYIGIYRDARDMRGAGQPSGIFG